MLLVDPRDGSDEYLKPLQLQGVQAESQKLESGDFAFIGRGIAGADVFIGIELKKIYTDDLINSLRSNRFTGHQLIGLQGYDRAWLLTEGIWRASDEGILEVMKGGWRTVGSRSKPIMAADLDAWLLTQTIRGGISHWHSSTRRDTVRFLATLYRWWTCKDLDEHRSHQAIYHAPPDRAMLSEPSTFVKMVSCLPNVGWEKAAALDLHFRGSLTALCTASAQELQDVPGIGKKIAERIVQALQ